MLPPYDTSDGSKPALWTLLPFYFTVWGAGLGTVFELALLFHGTPFQQNLNAFTQWVSRLRLLNLPFVASSIFFFYICLTVPETNEMLLISSMYGFTALAFALAPALFFGGLDAGGYDFVPPILIAIQVVEFVFVVTRGAISGGAMATYVLAAAPVFQILAFLVTTATPIRSFGFHVLSTLAGLSLYIALELEGNASPDCTQDLHIVLMGPETTKVWPVLLTSAAFGWTMMMKVAPKVYQNFRSEWSFYIWSVLYYVLVGAPSQPVPLRLSAIFREQKPKRATLQPYSHQHPYDVSPNLGIPAIRGELPQTVQANASNIQQILGLFNIISRMDYFIPQADVDAPLVNKPRIPAKDDGQDQYPSILFNTGLMEQFPAMGKTLQRCPKPAVTAYKEGKLLPWLCQYGIGNTFLKKAVETEQYPFFELVGIEEETNGKETGLVVDFRDLEDYEYKEDYEPYGGVAFFGFDDKNLCLRWLITPRTQRKVEVNEKTHAFRRAESMIISSLYFSVIAGKHLAEIHMSYNLLEVAAHNSFDVALNEYGPRGDESFNAHPLRLYLYIHLFSHGLAEEQTTEHLVQKGAVFSQIFAMKYESLVNYLSDQYNDITYAVDEDFEYRKAIMEPLTQRRRESLAAGYSDVAPYSSVVDWESQYFETFQEYAAKVVRATYGDDDTNVKKDRELQAFYETLCQYFNQLPKRYEEFKTLQGVTRFLADSTHHLVVRHQYYGTTAVAAAMDPRLGSTQVPKDGGPPAVDEWRALAFIALATAYANFVHLVPNLNRSTDAGNDNKDDKTNTCGAISCRTLGAVFEDATPVGGDNNSTTKTRLVKEMKHAWMDLQNKLEELNEEWVKQSRTQHYGTEKRVDPLNWERDINYMYCRPLPQDLHSGPGY